eukprot:4645412-Amphidinium_carterae.2
MLTLQSGGKFKLDATLVGNRLRLLSWFRLVPEKADILKEAQDLAGLLFWEGRGGVPPELTPCEGAIEEKQVEEEPEVAPTANKAPLSKAQRPTPHGPPPCLRLTPSSVSLCKWFCSRQTSQIMPRSVRKPLYSAPSKACAFGLVV